MSHEKLKIFIASSLFLIGLITISIFLVTYSNSEAFPYLFFLFSFFWIAIFIPRKLSKLDITPKRIMIICVLLVIISLTFLASSVKTYSDKEQELKDMQSQIDEISKLNEYYSIYKDSLLNETKKSIENSNLLQIKIDNLNSQSFNNQQMDTSIQPVIELVQREEEEVEEDD